MTTTTMRVALVALIGWAAPPGVAAQTVNATLDAMVEAREVPVTIDNFARAASDIELHKYVTLAGGINRFYHFREPTPVDNQPTIRMNRDTLYSTAVVDISEGATLTLPDVGERYMSAMIVNQEHYISAVFHGGGTYALDVETFETLYVIVYMRTLVDADDSEDVAAVNAIQDRMTIEAASSNPFILPDYDEEAYDALVERLGALLQFAGGIKGTFGKRDDVMPLRHLIGTAVGWGALPETEAMYPANVPDLPMSTYRIGVPADVPVGAFWSVSLYNAEGFFEKNAIDGYVVNSIMPDENWLPINREDMDLDIIMRLYAPDLERYASWTAPIARKLD